MEGRSPHRPVSAQPPTGQDPWLWLLVLGCVVLVLLGIIARRVTRLQSDSAAKAELAPKVSGSVLAARKEPFRRNRVSGAVERRSAEEIVAEKVSRFAHGRRAITRAMAEKFKVQVTPDIDRFFGAAESGNWDEVQAAFAALRQRREAGEGTNGLQTLWGPLLETYGVEQVAHNWPAQKLLDYGQAVLDSLQPGMIYLGGTDPGRFIPTLLNDTSDGDHHIVLTQNALADNSYLQYVNFLYGDQMTTLTAEDSQQAFQNYIADLQKRYDHDQQSPDEPKELAPGEQVTVTDGRVQVSGQVAVMRINEGLFQMIMDKNPDATFALEESFPFKSTYAQAVPLGPVMEVRVPDAQSTFTADTAAETISYWNAATQQLLADTGSTADDSLPLQAYSKLIVSQAHLLDDRGFGADAEQAYQLATQLSPGNPEAVFSYVNLLASQSRQADAVSVVEKALQAAPDNVQFQGLLENLKSVAK